MSDTRDDAIRAAIDLLEACSFAPGSIIDVTLAKLRAALYAPEELDTILRDRFAGLAMQGMLASGSPDQDTTIARASYEMADAMLAARHVP